MNILRQSAMTFKSADTAFEKRTGDLRIPLSHHDTEDHVRGIGHFRGIVITQVMHCSCHSDQEWSILLIGNALDVGIDGLILNRVEVLLLHGLIQLQRLIVLTLTLKDLTSLDQEGG